MYTYVYVVREQLNLCSNGWPIDLSIKGSALKMIPAAIQEFGIQDKSKNKQFLIKRFV